jgi:hypothetical protein
MIMALQSGGVAVGPIRGLLMPSVAPESDDGDTDELDNDQISLDDLEGEDDDYE